MPRPAHPPISPQQQPHTRRPSISTPMQWLSRNNSRPSPERTGGLGKGATVVRTPEDALRDTNVRVTYDSNVKVDAPHPPPSSSGSPPLPPLPLPQEDELELLEETPKRPPRPARTIPTAPSPTPSSSSSQPSSLRPSLKSRSSTAVDDPPHVPPVPSHIPLSPPVPPFTPILMSGLPVPDADPANIIVALETCTTVFKSTLLTLCSSPSYLADYLTSLTRQRTNSHASSVYSTESADIETYRGHLTSQGLLRTSSSPTTIHIFLDRPSAPYAHILTFLRTPHISPESPALPRAVQLSSLTHTTSTSSFNAKLEVLLELRDESAYLGLDSLHKLCTDEIRQRLSHAPRLHTRGNSQGSINPMIGPGLLPTIGSGQMSIHSQHASVYSLHTLAEHFEGDLTATKIMDHRVSRGSDSLEEEIIPQPDSYAKTTVTRHHKNPSLSSTVTSRAAPSPSHSPSHSPPQPYTRPVHKKSESTMSFSTHKLNPSEDNSQSEGRDRGKKPKRHSPSSSVGLARTGVRPPPAGWI